MLRSVLVRDVSRPRKIFSKGILCRDKLQGEKCIDSGGGLHGVRKNVLEGWRSTSGFHYSCLLLWPHPECHHHKKWPCLSNPLQTWAPYPPSSVPVTTPTTHPAPTSHSLVPPHSVFFPPHPAYIQSSTLHSPAHRLHSPSFCPFLEPLETPPSMFFFLSAQRPHPGCWESKQPWGSLMLQTYTFLLQLGATQPAALSPCSETLIQTNVTEILRCIWLYTTWNCTWGSICKTAVYFRRGFAGESIETASCVFD